jgi:hypothetical protein
MRTPVEDAKQEEFGLLPASIHTTPVYDGPPSDPASSWVSTFLTLYAGKRYHGGTPVVVLEVSSS